MADTIQERIIDYVVGALEGITTDNGYAVNINRVERFRVSGPSSSLYPMIVIAMQFEDDATTIYPVTEAVMHMEMEVWDTFGDEEDLDARLGVLRAEIQEALMDDVTCGGLAHSLEITSQQNMVMEGERLGVARISADIAYSFLSSDPYAQSVTYAKKTTTDDDFYQTILDVEEAIISILVSAAITGVNGIVFNNELRSGKLLAPYLRVLPEPSDVNARMILKRQYWDYNFLVIGVASSYAAGDEVIARRIALKAITALKESGDLNLQLKAQDLYVENLDTRFTRELPGAGQVFGTAVGMRALVVNNRW